MAFGIFVLLVPNSLPKHSDIHSCDWAKPGGGSLSRYQTVNTLPTWNAPAARSPAFLLRYNRLMRVPLLAAAAVIGLTVLMVSTPPASAQSNPQKDTPAKESAPDVPDAIAVPAGLEPVLFVRAQGSQIYTCQAGADGKFSWTLKGPAAELKDRKDKVIGQHSAGPTWKLKDGSEVTGKAVAQVDSLDADSIPWLLVSVESHAGKSGLLSNVTTIQRVHTHGGKSGHDACDESHKGAETKSDYTADYYFYAPAK
jgi:hypothetical protein